MRIWGFGSGIFFTLDPGWKKFGSGINIWDPGISNNDFKISYKIPAALRFE
jgi:hypothetical protein